MLNAPSEDAESASREEVLAALAQLSEYPDRTLLRGMKDETVEATAAQRFAATAILGCIEAVEKRGGLNIGAAVNRIYMYSLTATPPAEIYQIAYTSDPAHPSWPTKTEDVYGCRAILEAMRLAGATL
jgi:hypothetical protein